MANAQKSQRASEKRERILEGALKAFAKKGFYNTKVSEIATEAGVADGTIYLYFKNKDDLLISLFEDRMEFLIERLTLELAKIEGTLEKFRAAITLHLQMCYEEPDLAEFITVELRQSAKFVKEYDNPKFHDYLHVIVAIVAEGQREGLVREDVDARLVARALFGSLDEMLLQLTLSEAQPPEVAERARQLANLFIDGVTKR